MILAASEDDVIIQVEIKFYLLSLVEGHIEGDRITAIVSIYNRCKNSMRNALDADMIRQPDRGLPGYNSWTCRPKKCKSNKRPCGEYGDASNPIGPDVRDCYKNIIWRVWEWDQECLFNKNEEHNSKVEWKYGYIPVQTNPYKMEQKTVEVAYADLTAELSFLPCDTVDMMGLTFGFCIKIVGSGSVTFGGSPSAVPKSDDYLRPWRPKDGQMGWNWGQIQVTGTFLVWTGVLWSSPP